MVPMDLSTDWSVQFGKDASPTTMPTLHSWTDDAATRTFSGVCTYTKHFTLDPEVTKSKSHHWLTFGSGVALASKKSGPGFQADLDAPVRDAANVYINGHRAGSVWAPPYQLDVTRWLIAGENLIRIEVGNTAVNAISANGFPNYNAAAVGREFGVRFNPPPLREFHPIPSGLLGPIELH